MKFKHFFDRARSNVKGYKARFSLWLNDGVRIAEQQHGHIFRVAQQCDRIIARTPGCRSMLEKAKDEIRKRQSDKTVLQIVNDIQTGKIVRIPENKRAASLILAELESGGVKVNDAMLLELGLDSGDYGAIKQLVKNYF